MTLLQDIIVVAVRHLFIEKDKGFKVSIVVCDAILHGSLTLILAEISPGRLDARDRAFVDSFGISNAELEEHLSGDIAIVEYLRFHSLEDTTTERGHLLDELWSEFAILDLLQGLKVSLLLSRTHHCIAVTILEEVYHKSTDSVLFLDVVRGTLLLLKCIFQVLFRSHGVSVLILESQGKIPHYP